MKACRLDLVKLELLRNHVPQGVTARHCLETSDLRDDHQEVQAIGDYIENEASLAAAKASGANVMPLRAKVRGRRAALRGKWGGGAGAG